MYAYAYVCIRLKTRQIGQFKGLTDIVMYTSAVLIWKFEEKILTFYSRLKPKINKSLKLW